MYVLPQGNMQKNKKLKEWNKMDHANTNHENTEATCLKVDCRARIVTRRSSY